MIKTIIRIVRNAVAAAFKAMKRAALFAAGTVGGMVDALFASEASLPEPEYEEVFAPDEAGLEQVAEEHMNVELTEADASNDLRAVCYRYVCTPADQRHDINLSNLSPETGRWVQRLSDAECLLVRKSGLQGMLRHMNGKKLIPGVARVPSPVLDFTQTSHEVYDLNDFAPEVGAAMRIA